MAGSKSNYLEQKLLDLVLGGSTYSPAATVYVALSSAAYSDTATGASFSEITTGGAARVAVTNNATNWPAANSSSQKSNAGTITFPTATGTWPTAQSFYILDGASTSANVLYGGDLATPRTLSAGDTASFAAGAIVITED